MNKLYLSLLFLLLLTACASTEANAPPLPLPLATRTALVTGTAAISPTPTVDYQSVAFAAQTAQVNAQGTADAARAEVEAAHIAAAQITAQAEQNAIQVAMITQEAYSISAAGTQMVIESTSTAAPISIPLTATQQVINNTAIASYLTMESVKVTATSEAPDVLRRMKDAEAYNATANFWGRVWVQGMIGVFLLFMPIAVFTLRKRPYQESKPQETELEPEPVVVDELKHVTDVMVKRNSETIYPSAERMIIPCTPEQFTALVDGILSGSKTFSFRLWSTKESPFTAVEYGEVRRALLLHRLVKCIPPDNRLTLTEEGEEMFRGWLDRQELTGGFDFGTLPQHNHDRNYDGHDEITP